MQKLIEYLTNHKGYKLKYIQQHFTSDNMLATLTKYGFSWYELCYRIQHHISLDKIFTCKHCGKKIEFNLNHRKYFEFCSDQCSNIYKNKSLEHRNKIKKTFKAKYGVAHYSQTQEYKDKVKQTCLDRYGVDSFSKTQEYRDKSKKAYLNKYGVDHYSKTQESKDNLRAQEDVIKAKRKQTCLERYGKEYYSQTDEHRKYLKNNADKFQQNIKQICLDKYGVDNYSKTKEFQEKTYNTKKANGTSSTSGPEKRSLDLLKEHFTEVKDHYRTEQYPFECDAYIKDIDTYIEFNYHWTHGKEPFDKDNVEHQKILSKWNKKIEEINFKGEKKNYFKTAMQVWIERDPLKVKVAKKNNIKLMVFYKENDFKEWLKVGV